MSPIGEMRAVTSLDVGGDWMSSRIAHVASISFLRRMPQLQKLLLHTMIADDLDYTPIVELPALTHLRVMKARGMRPTHEQLKTWPAWSDTGDW
jgi:predicted esterase